MSVLLFLSLSTTQKWLPARAVEQSQCALAKLKHVTTTTKNTMPFFFVRFLHFYLPTGSYSYYYYNYCCKGVAGNPVLVITVRCCLPAFPTKYPLCPPRNTRRLCQDFPHFNQFSIVYRKGDIVQIYPFGGIWVDISDILKHAEIGSRHYHNKYKLYPRTGASNQRGHKFHAREHFDILSTNIGSLRGKSLPPDAENFLKSGADRVWGMWYNCPRAHWNVAQSALLIVTTLVLECIECGFSFRKNVTIVRD